MSFTNISDRLAEALVAKGAATGQERFDLSLQDFAVLRDGHSARVLIGYQANQKEPTASAIAQYITAKFEGKLSPKLETARIHPEQRAVSVVVATERKTRKLNDRRGLLEVVANTLYLDQTLNTNWRVETNPETGHKFLACVRDEDITGMLKNAQASVTTARFTGSSTAVGFILPEKGDYVEFFADEGLRQGEVVKIKDDEVSIVEEGGATYLVPTSGITKMLKKNPKSQSQKDEELIRALTPAMVTRELAEKLIRGE